MEPTGTPGPRPPPVPLTAFERARRVIVAEGICASFDPDLHQLSMSKIPPMFATVRSSADLSGELS